MSEGRTIGEAYSSATESSDLRVRAERRGDVDTLIAAGWVLDGLGTMLYRLQVEFDSVRAVLRGPGPLSPIERFLILDRLKSLRPTRQALGACAVDQAERVRFYRPQRDVMRVTGRVLDVFLDPLCHHCEGRGFNGGTHRGEPQVLCRPCRGSGHRRDQIGKDELERHFAAFMLAQLEAWIGEVDRIMLSYLRRA